MYVYFNSNYCFLEMPAIVTTLLGWSNLTCNIYAFSSHGDAFITSADEGNTWYSIPENVFTMSKSSKYFVQVTISP